MEDNKSIQNDNFRPKAVAELLATPHRFIIPSYQRGYRWEKKQVLDLLNDLKQFADDSNNEENASYYLQPLVIKPVVFEGEDCWEVLDGQQRLTTMLLLLQFCIDKNILNEFQKEFYNEKLYSIRYTNRPQLDFKKIDDIDPIKNIDSFYVRQAYSIIYEWFRSNHSWNVSKLTEVLFFSESKRQAKFIWYVVDRGSEDVKSIQTFNRLNKGKISLTSSELVKALFIMDYDNDTSRRESSEQLAIEWDSMEKRFQDDEFFYFISNGLDETESRFDVLFDFMTKRPKNTEDADYSYRIFQNLYDYCRGGVKENDLDELWKNSKTTSMHEAWTELKKVFDRLEAWYADSTYYHYVGFLINHGMLPIEVYSELERLKGFCVKAQPDKEWGEADSLKALRYLIAENAFKGVNASDIDNWNYEQNKDMIPRLFLLMNVEQYRRSRNQRFSFNLYKSEGWDMEHIDSRNTASLQLPVERLGWLRQASVSLKLEPVKAEGDPHAISRRIDEAVKRITCDGAIKDEEAKNVEEDYKNFHNEVVRYYCREGNQKIDEVKIENIDKDNISNLTLLSAEINRGYKDAPFPSKRQFIIAKDRNGESFIPICTRNVFLKYYSNSSWVATDLQALRWNSNDRRDYVKAIHDVVDEVFTDAYNFKEKLK